MISELVVVSDEQQDKKLIFQMYLLQQERLYFLPGLDKSSASASLAFLARIPHRRATALAWRTLLKAWNLKKKIVILQ